MGKNTTVVVVNWNGTRFLETLLASMKRENPEKVIVIDNASTDGSLDLLLQHPEVQTIANRENVGFGIAANQGIEAAITPYVLLLNADVELRSGSIDLLERFLNENQRCAVVAPQLIFPDGRLQPSCRKFPTPFTYAMYLSYLDLLIPTGYRLPASSHDKAMQVDQPMGAALMLRKQSLEETGAFDPQFSLFMEEVDLCERVKHAGWSIYYLPEAKIVHHAGGSTGQDWSSSQAKHFQNVIRYFRKRLTLFQMVPCKLQLSAALLIRSLVFILRGKLSEAAFYFMTSFRLLIW